MATRKGGGAPQLSMEYHQYKWIQDRWDARLAKAGCRALRLPYFDLAEAPGKDVETPGRHPLEVSDHSSHAMRFRMSTSVIRHVLKSVEKDTLPLNIYAFGPIFFRDESPVPRHSEKFTYLNLGYSNFETVIGVIHVLNALLSDIGMDGYSIRLNDLSIVNAFLNSLPVDPFIRNIVLFHLHEIKDLRGRGDFEEYLAEGFGLRRDAGHSAEKIQERVLSNEVLSAAMNLALSEMDLPTHSSRGREEIVQNVLKKFERKRSLRSLLERFSDLHRYLRIKAEVADKTALKALEKAARAMGVEEKARDFLEFAGMASRLPRFGGVLRLDASLSAWSIFYDKAIFRVDLEQDSKGAVFGLGGSSDTVCGAVLPGNAVPTSGFTLDMDMLASRLGAIKGKGALEVRSADRPLDFLIIPVDPTRLIYAYRVLDRLTDKGFHAQVETGGHLLEDALKKVSRMGVKRVLVLGEEEERKGTVIIRDMKGNKQKTLKLAELLSS